MKLKEVKLRHLKMTMKAPFATSFGSFQDKEFILLEATDELGNTGWGESVAFEVPWYNEETFKTNWHMLEDFLIPALLNKEITHPDEVNEIFSSIRKNNMAKSTIEGAVWDLYAKRNQIPLAKALGGEKKKIEVGISIGIQKSVEDLLQLIEGYVNEGYKRMKVKIKPGWDIDVMRQVREKFPDILLMADANSAYRLSDIQHLKQLDEFNLMMIEQPLASDDIVDHAKLQAEMKTPICLDESIHSLEDTRKAVELGSCKIINIKIGRVGGLTEAKKIHDYCQEQGIAVWCGGMLESGVGRAHNVALTTLANFIMPGDTAGSSRYWEKDIITPEVVVEDGYITVPENDGIGYAPDLAVIEKYTIMEKTYQ
ncbi:o-succinylbenzoate synthase [Cytobacillus sp. FSL W7-1323]|uniref:o-succinylbenzoate synthase n=1 Tax=Cytobacillus kochii TaxID=859143 RepID=A0A248TN40_9BACI|nr:MULTISPECIES: o-succinylbenzoate synthase [Cytobacillus]ASV69555.1 o-succinylbenzoate synthase [Cytobacillus kochii]MEA1852489.1 o-succinylbenzoate synthase [Cytobacillus sp. OWB-43]MED1604638.1 o-succinylbenzoate synthase [Cytobacillus kochii]